MKQDKCCTRVEAHVSEEVYYSFHDCCLSSHSHGQASSSGQSLYEDFLLFAETLGFRPFSTPPTPPPITRARWVPPRSFPLRLTRLCLAPRGDCHSAACLYPVFTLSSPCHHPVWPLLPSLCPESKAQGTPNQRTRCHCQ